MWCQFLWSKKGFNQKKEKQKVNNKYGCIPLYPACKRGLECESKKKPENVKTCRDQSSHPPKALQFERMNLEMRNLFPKEEWEVHVSFKAGDSLSMILVVMWLASWKITTPPQKSHEFTVNETSGKRTEKNHLTTPEFLTFSPMRNMLPFLFGFFVVAFQG